MNGWLYLIIFLFLYVVYLNFLEEIKIGKDLEILEMDYVNNEHLQETCRTKQPLIFSMKNGFILPDSHYLYTFDLVEFSKKYGKEKLAVYETPKQFSEISLEDAIHLFVEESETNLDESDPQVSHTVKLWSENNMPFIEETPLQRYCRSCDIFLAPFGTISTDYDFWLGSPGVTIPVRYHRRHSYFMLVIQGEIIVQLAPFKYSKVLGPNNATSWNEYVTLLADAKTNSMADKDIPWMEVQVSTGNCLFVPPYWWHEIQFTKNTQVVVFMYDNLMNAVLMQLSEWRDKLLTVVNHYE